MMTDGNDGELELNFGSPAENKAPEAVPAELPLEAAASGTPAENGAVPPAASVPAEAVTVTVSAPDPVLRSRLPANRPAGTPPLTAALEDTAQHPALPANASYGPALRAIREAAQLDYKEVERNTQITARNLEAIETENLDILPPLVYVIAYIRTLCRFYHVGKADADQLVAKLKEQLEYPCNQELMNSLEVDNSGAEDNERRLRKMFLTAGGIAVLLLLVVALILFLACRKPAAAPAAEPEKPVAAQEAITGDFDVKSIDPLLEPATPKLVKLPIAE